VGVPKEDVVDAAGSDELYLGFVWNGFRQWLTLISFVSLVVINRFETPFGGISFQISMFFILFVIVLSTGKTFHFDTKTDIFRYHQTFMLLSLSWIEAGRVSHMRVARFITKETYTEDGRKMTHEELHLLFSEGEPFHFVSILGRSHLERIKSKINRFLFVNRVHGLDLETVDMADEPSTNNEVDVNKEPSLGETKPDETSAFW
jgi:hypothetical protein